MKVIIELETAEEREMLNMQGVKFVHARSTAIFFRREMVPVGYYMNVPAGYKEKLYVEVALDSLVTVEVPSVINELKA